LDINSSKKSYRIYLYIYGKTDK